MPDQKKKETFGYRLKKLRERKKLTQGQLAEKLEVDQSTISNYERDTKRPDFEMIQKIAAFFEVNIDYLTMRTDYDFSPDMIYSVKEDGSEKLYIGESKYTQAQARFMRHVASEKTITAEDLKEKFNLVVDGRTATEDEIDEAIRYILIQRMMKESKNKDN